jgi:bisanhydrobacterioruberin hydratase
MLLNSAFLKWGKKEWSIAVVVITHTVGIIGFLSPYKEYFIMLTPMQLILSTGLLLYHQSDKNQYFMLTCMVVYLMGFTIEMIGVNTGLIFGHYQYDTALGTKVFETPLMIGINWLMLILSIGTVFNRIKAHWIFKALFAATAMTVLDYLIEPVAVQYDFWHWYSDSIPLQNYAGWLALSFILFLIFYKMPFEKKNNLALAVFAMQVVFFSALNVFG